MPNRSHEKKLLVEGREDKRLIPQLIEANGIPWGETEADWIVAIEEYNGVEEILKPGVIEVELKASGLRILGILLDANESLWCPMGCAAKPMFATIPNFALGSPQGRRHYAESGWQTLRGLAISR